MAKDSIKITKQKSFMMVNGETMKEMEKGHSIYLMEVRKKVHGKVYRLLVNHQLRNLHQPKREKKLSKNYINGVKGR